MSRHHPDKLKANGMPDSMLEHAKQRTQADPRSLRAAARSSAASPDPERRVERGHEYALDRAFHPLRQLRAAGRGSRCRAGRRRRHRALRRDGQPLRAEPDHRPAGVRGAAQAWREGAHRCAPDGEAGGSHHSGFRQGGRLDHQLPPGSQRACGSHHRADPRAGLPGRAGVQPGDAAALPGPHAGQARPGADHVGEPRLRRPEVHSRRAGQAARSAPAHRRQRPGGAAGGRWRREGGQHRRRSRAPAPTPSWRARRSSGRRTIAP